MDLDPARQNRDAAHSWAPLARRCLRAAGRAHLVLVQQAHALLYPTLRPFLYAGVYDLIGIAQHFERQDQEALHAHQAGYLAALATGDAWYVAQSLICQADCYHALGAYQRAIQTIEEALRILAHPLTPAHRRATAHSLTCWADNAMALQDVSPTKCALRAVVYAFLAVLADFRPSDHA